MQPIFIVAGPPAAGKSTISRALASKFNPSIHIAVDDIRDMVVSGLVLPGPEWSAELVRQIRLARESGISMALHYQKAGFAVVIDDFFDQNHMMEYQGLLNLPDVYKILLYPDQEIANERNIKRSDSESTSAYIAAGIRAVYQQLNASIAQLRQEGWFIVDTSDLSVEDTVVEIQNLRSD